MMKHELKRSARFATCAAAILCLALLTPAVPAPAQTVADKIQDAQPPVSEKHKLAIAEFEKRAKAYSKMREAVERELPKLPKEATPEQIMAHKVSFEAAVRAARGDAKPGNIFTPDINEYIRATIKDEFKGQERRELREEVLTAENKAVPIRVNYTYPDTQEQVEIAPTLLLRLPQLTKHLKYRFVGRNLLLVDRENGLIVDYMTDALP